VVVPTRDSARTIGACLASLRHQTHAALEVIVVDNASVDGTLDAAAELADVVVTGGPERSAQRNAGAAAAAGTYLFFVDSDMRVSPDVVAEAVALVATAATPAVIVPEDSQGIGFWARCRALERSCYEGDDSVEAARFYTAAAFAAAGGFDEQLTGGEDWDLSRRVGHGARLPRTASRIVHDEGQVRLGGLLARKRYYGRAAAAHFAKRGSGAAAQANLVFRPAFARHWRRLASHPVVACGMLAMKAAETIAALLGAAEGWRGRGGRPESSFR
jgi:glycosyltransferase involved in cell wall biosynthesis